MSKIFKPRRILASKAASLNPVLAAGEMIIEVPDTGVGTGPCIMKIGDGTTSYTDLPISMGGTADNIVYSGAIDGAAITNVKLALDNLISKYNSFNDAKSTIINSALGKALGLTSNSTIATVASTINGVVDRGVSQNAGGIGWGSDYYALNNIPEGYYRKNGYDWAPEIRIARTKFGNAETANVLSGKTFTSSVGINASGTMANRGNLNWSGSNTTYSVSAGYYTGGTLDSRPSYNNGYSAGNSAGYSSGRTQGQNDVKNSPNSYGLYTKAQYDSNWSGGYNSGYNAGVSAKTSNISSGHVTTGNSVYLGWQPNIILIKRDGDKLPAGLYSSIGVNINYMEGPSQSHQDNVIWTNGDSFGFSNLSSYNNNKYCYYVAARIV